VALVTGVGRRRGIGSAICRALAESGADVFFTYWKAYDRDAPWATDEDEPEALREELRSPGVRAEGIEVDLSLSPPSDSSMRSPSGLVRLPSS
jgi:3-oxoacyl-[acyl-carrier protein] reductase